MQHLRLLLLPGQHFQQLHNLGQPLLPFAQQACSLTLPALLTQQQQQLLLPAQRQQTSHASTAASKPPPSLHERRVANLKFCQERALWRLQLKELRKQWLQEHQLKQREHRAEVQAARQQIEQLRALRQESRREDRERHTLEREVRDAQRAHEVAMRRLASAYREHLRQATLRKFREQQRAALLEESRSWIPPEQLQERIAAALDNPLRL